MKFILDNVKSQLIVEPRETILYGDIISECRTYTKMTDPGNFWARKRNPKMRWDGSVYFMTEKGSFATGFFPNFYRFIIKDLKVPEDEIEIVDERINLPEFKKDLSVNVGPYELKDFQIDVIKKCNKYVAGLYWPRGIIDAATNTGKTAIIGALYMSLNTKNTLYLIHNKEIFDQTFEFFSSYPELYGEIGTITASKIDIKPFTIAMVKTLYNRFQTSLNIKSWLGNIDCLFIDESHHVAGSQYAKLVAEIQAGARFMVSGTPLSMSDKITRVRLTGLSGERIAVITSEFLRNVGQSIPARVFMYLNSGDLIFGDYSDVRDTCFRSEKRMGIIQNYIKQNPDRQILICFDFLDHGKFMYDKLVKICNCRYLYGGSENRDELVNDFKDCKYRVLITNLFQEGINAPIDTLIYAIGGESEISLKQYIGRLIRMAGKYSEGHIVDFFDNYEYLNRHSRKRIKIYEKEGYPIEYQYNHTKYGSPIF